MRTSTYLVVIEKDTGGNPTIYSDDIECNNRESNLYTDDIV